MDAEGRKYDVGKLRLDLIPPEVTRALGEILTYGAGKYGDKNWEKGISEDRLYAALQRHLLAWREGEAKDEESGLSHLVHALCNLAMLVTFERRHEVLKQKIENTQMSQGPQENSRRTSSRGGEKNV